MASRVIRVSPCDEPCVWGGEKRSMPSTLRPRFANCHVVALPMAPSPSTTDSQWFINPLYPFSHRGKFPIHDNPVPLHLMSLKIIPTGAALGAEIAGVDLRRLPDREFGPIHRAWIENLVLLFRGQKLTD